MYARSSGRRAGYWSTAIQPRLWKTMIFSIRRMVAAGGHSSTPARSSPRITQHRRCFRKASASRRCSFGPDRRGTGGSCRIPPRPVAVPDHQRRIHLAASSHRTPKPNHGRDPTPRHRPPRTAHGLRPTEIRSGISHGKYKRRENVEPTLSGPHRRCADIQSRGLRFGHTPRLAVPWLCLALRQFLGIRCLKSPRAHEPQ